MRNAMSIAAEATFRARVIQLGGTVIDPVWHGSLTPHKVRCASGHYSSPTPSNVSRGQGLCRACVGNDPKTSEAAFHRRVAELGGRVLEPIWRGAALPHRIRCVVGHISTPQPNHVNEGLGICRSCAGKDPATAERAFRETVAKSGGMVLEPKWLGARTPHRIRCAAGHLISPLPTSMQSGRGICRICIGFTWDIFYIVINQDLQRVKFGITSIDARPRLSAHRRNGYANVDRTLTIQNAELLELEVKSTLGLAGISPVQGYEYFDLSALPVILDVVDNWSADAIAAIPSGSIRQGDCEQMSIFAA